MTAASRPSGGGEPAGATRGGPPGPEPAGPVSPAPFVNTPNAERYLLQADNLRRRQLHSALLHGSGRTWRDQRRLWPALVAGLIAVAVISAAIAVYGAFQQHERERAEEERERQEQEREREEEEEEEEQRQREVEGMPLEPRRREQQPDQPLAITDLRPLLAGSPTTSVRAWVGGDVLVALGAIGDTPRAVGPAEQVDPTAVAMTESPLTEGQADVTLVSPAMALRAQDRR